MKARVIVTMDCPRNCENCCNKEEVFNNHRVITDIKELLKYDEVMITGGEPMLIPEKVLEFIHQLRTVHGYQSNIYLYSALYNSTYMYDVLSNINGIHYTLHYEATDKDVFAVKIMSEIIKNYPNVLSRLAIDSRLYDRYDFSNIDFTGWDVVRKLKWLVNCPLPKNEELLIYKL